MGDFAPLNNKIIDKTHGQASTKTIHEHMKKARVLRKREEGSKNDNERHILKLKVKFKRHPRLCIRPKAEVF